MCGDTDPTQYDDPVTPMPRDESTGRIRSRTEVEFWASFWARVDTSGDCWLWMGQVNNHGYGRVKTPGADTVNGSFVHRLAWQHVYGPIPAGMHVLHRCDNPRCVRLSHLWLGTHADNMRDASIKGRLNVPRPRVLGLTCRRGHDRATNMRPATRGFYCRQCHAEHERDRKRRLRVAS